MMPSVAFGLGVLLGGTFGGLAMALFAGRRVGQLERQIRWLRIPRIHAYAEAYQQGYRDARDKFA